MPAGNRLQWTADVSGPSSFRIERSEDGIHFTPVTTIFTVPEAAQHFSYTDEKAAGSVLYYRLRLLDEAGSVSYSAVVKLQGGEQRTTALLYPTVATTQVQLFIKATTMQTIIFQMIAPEGRVLRSGTLPAKQGGQTYSLSVDGLQKGRYFLSLQSGDGRAETLSFIKG